MFEMFFLEILEQFKIWVSDLSLSVADVFLSVSSLFHAHCALSDEIPWS